MAGDFDPYDKESWYFGTMSREEANNILNKETESGVFLVRNSSSYLGEIVLCVREGDKVSHYIINKVVQGNQTRFRIGDQMFPDVPSLLSFYKLHILDKTSLVRPVKRILEKVRALFDFEGSGDADDLPFKKNEILTIITKDEESWWTAKNKYGQSGSIPANYVETIDSSQIESENRTTWNRSSSPNANTINATVTSQQNSARQLPPKPQYNTPHIQRRLPAFARVKQARVPNAYDKSALKLEVGELVKVTKTNLDGQWEGEINGKKGLFPFNFVDFIDVEDEKDLEAINS